MVVKSKKYQIKLEELQGFKLIKKFRRILRSTNTGYLPHPSELDSRRNLAGKDYFSLFLFTYLNPVIKGMRGLCEATKLDKIQENVSSHYVSRGSFSEAQAIFNPQHLLSVIQTLSKQFQPTFGDKRIQKVCKELVAVDGTLLRALPRMTWALWQDEDHRSAKLHFRQIECRKVGDFWCQAKNFQPQGRRLLLYSGAACALRRRHNVIHTCQYISHCPERYLFQSITVFFALGCTQLKQMAKVTKSISPLWILCMQ